MTDTPFLIPRRSLVRWLSAGLATAFLLTIPFRSTAATDKAPIEIGMAVSLTGFIAALDGPFVDGAKLAAKAINDHGGVNGHLLNLHVIDNASNATTGVTAVNQLLNQYGVTVMINGLSSAQSTAVEPIAARAKVPVLVFSDLPENAVWSFGINVPRSRDNDIQLQFAKERLRAKSIAVVFSQTPYGQNNSRLMADGADKLGIKVVKSLGVEGSVTEMTPVMATVKDATPDALIDILNGATHIVETKAAATVGLKVPIVMTSDDMATQLKSNEAYPNIYFSLRPIQAYPTLAYPQLRAPIERFRAAYKAAGLDSGNELGASAGWDAINILARAISTGDATSGDALRNALERTRWQGVNSLFAYSSTDHTGQKTTPNPIEMAKFVNGAISVVYGGH